MKKGAILLVAVMMILGALGTAKASYMALSQRYYFDYTGSSYYGFIYDYSIGYQESNTGGFISYDAYLLYTAQGPGSGYTTHVAYIYDSGLGRYVEAMATLDHMM